MDHPGGSGTPRGFLNTSKQRQRPLKEDEKKVNPFDKDALNLSRRPIWSPSIFKSDVTTTPPVYDWSIDEISKLKPVNIEDSPSSHQHSEELSESTEANFQANSYTFFKNNPLPSPPHKKPDETLGIYSRIENQQSLLDNHPENQCEPMDISLQKLRTLQFSFDDSATSIRSEDLSGCQPWSLQGAMIMSPNANQNVCQPSSNISSDIDIDNDSPLPEDIVHCSTPTTQKK